MIFLGRAISMLAASIIPHRWKRLQQELRRIYDSYCTCLKGRISPILLTTLIVAEDHRFYGHTGIDLIAIVRALWRVAVLRTWHGGSTIEQQLVRTVTGDYNRSLARKIREILLATLVHKVIPKSDVPGVYLSVAYFGWQMNGLVQACHRLLIDLNKMTPQQASFLVARLKYPEPRAASPQRIHQIDLRSRYILGRTAKRCPALRPGEMEVSADEALPDF